MNILVNATALNKSGARTILEQFLYSAKKAIDLKFYVFVEKDYPEVSSDNIFFIKVDIKGWFDRVKWDVYSLNRHVSLMGIKFDRFLSLQNTSVYLPGVKQVLYIHQPLPFTNVKFNLFSNFKLFLYQKFYAKFIFMFSNNVASYIVQTQWMKKSLVNKFNADENDIYIIKPEHNNNVLRSTADECLELAHDIENNEISLFYPATPLTYKNHQVLLHALKYLRDNFVSYRVVLSVTLSKGDMPSFDKLVTKFGLDNAISYLGYIDRDKVYECYQNSTMLVFPSYLETFGLPLLEAASCGTKVLASDLDYAREVLNGYKGAKFANYKSPISWAEEIINLAELDFDGNHLSHMALVGLICLIF